MKKRFVSYREFWATVFIWAVIASGCVPLLMTVLKNGGNLILPAVWVAGIAAVAFFWFRSYCEFQDDYLLVVDGPVFAKYYYPQITGIKTTQGSRLFGSVPRVRFALYYNSILKRYVSPRDTDEFLKLFREKCPDATID